MLCALFHYVPVLAVTATANKMDMKCIHDSLGLKKCKFLVANPDRKNIFYRKVFYPKQDAESIQLILKPIAKDLLQHKINYPLTIIYISLKLCGFAYKRFE